MLWFPQSVMESRESMEEISALLGSSVNELKAEFANHLEKAFATVLSKMDTMMDRGPHRLIRNVTFQYIWKTYCPSADAVSSATLLDAIQAFMSEVLHADDAELQALWCEANAVAMRSSVDRDSSNSVCCSLNLMHGLRGCWAHTDGRMRRACRSLCKRSTRLRPRTRRSWTSSRV